MRSEHQSWGVWASGRASRDPVNQTLPLEGRMPPLTLCKCHHYPTFEQNTDILLLHKLTKRLHHQKKANLQESPAHSSSACSSLHSTQPLRTQFWGCALKTKTSWSVSPGPREAQLPLETKESPGFKGFLILCCLLDLSCII